MRPFWALLMCISLTACKQGDSPDTAAPTLDNPAPPADVTTRTAPTIGGIPATIIEAGHEYRFRPTAASQDGGALTFRVANRPHWASFDASSGTLSGVPALDDAGDYPRVTISAAAGAVSASLAPFSIHVAAPPPVPPTIAGTPPTSIVSGVHYEFIPNASSPRGAPLTFGVANKPGWAQFDAATGALSGTPGAADVGHDDNILISASDGASSAQLPAFGIEVTSIAMGSASLSWTAPTENTNGSALTNLAGFHIHYGTSPAALTTIVNVPGTSVLRRLIENLGHSTWYFAVSSYTTTGAESDWSGVVSKDIP